MKRNVNCLIGFLVVLLMLPFGLYAEDTAEDELSFEITSKSQTCYFDASVTLSINQRVGPFELTAVNTETGQVIEEQFPFSTIKLKLIAGTYEICISDTEGNTSCETTVLTPYVQSSIDPEETASPVRTKELSLLLAQRGEGELVVSDLSVNAPQVIYENDFLNAEQFRVALPTNTPLLLEVMFDDDCYSSQYVNISDIQYNDPQSSTGQSKRISLYPNPNFGILHISDLDGMEKTIQVYSFSSILRYEITTEENQVDISALPPGNYIVVVTVGPLRYVEQIYLP